MVGMMGVMGLGLWVMGYGFMGLWFMGYSKIESIKNPANHLIIRSTGSDKWGLRLRIMLRVYGLWVHGFMGYSKF